LFADILAAAAAFFGMTVYRQMSLPDVSWTWFWIRQLWLPKCH